jgi:hypothetical protein
MSSRSGFELTGRWGLKASLILRRDRCEVPFFSFGRAALSVRLFLRTGRAAHSVTPWPLGAGANGAGNPMGRQQRPLRRPKERTTMTHSTNSRNLDFLSDLGIAPSLPTTDQRWPPAFSVATRARQGEIAPASACGLVPARESVNAPERSRPMTQPVDRQPRSVVDTSGSGVSIRLIGLAAAIGLVGAFATRANAQLVVDQQQTVHTSEGGAIAPSRSAFSFRHWVREHESACC